MRLAMAIQSPVRQIIRPQSSPRASAIECTEGVELAIHAVGRVPSRLTMPMVVINSPATEAASCSRPHDLDRADDAGLHHVLVFAGLGVIARHSRIGARAICCDRLLEPDGMQHPTHPRTRDTLSRSETSPILLMGGCVAATLSKVSNAVTFLHW